MGTGENQRDLARYVGTGFNVMRLDEFIEHHTAKPEVQVLILCAYARLESLVMAAYSDTAEKQSGSAFFVKGIGAVRVPLVRVPPELPVYRPAIRINKEPLLNEVDRLAGECDE